MKLNNYEAIHLINSDDIESKKKARLKSLMKYFYRVETVEPLSINWKSFQYHRNNATYKMLMNLCYLIISGMIISDSSGSHKLSEYIDDQKMHALYERFILEYFKKHHTEFSVAKKKISWNIDESDNQMIDLLPEMITDITLRYKDKVLIIDAKYYSDILSSSQFSENEKIRSPNIYQIFAYVKNMDKERTKKVQGMLLYAGTDKELPNELSVVMDGNKIHVKSLDLSGDWEEITDKLEMIAADFKGE